MYILAKNGFGRWSAFLWHFAFFVYRHHSAWFNQVQKYYYKRSHTSLNAFLEKSHRKADRLPEQFSGSIYLYEQCMNRMADSCTLALYVDGSGEYIRSVSRKYFEQRKVLHFQGMK